MAELKLNGMKAAYDEIITVAVKRQYEPPKIVAELLKAEFAEKKARSIKYQLTVAKMTARIAWAVMARRGTYQARPGA